MIENITTIQENEISKNASDAFNEGYRFITMTCTETDNKFEITYHFGKEYDMKHFRVQINKEQEIESISQTYFCAMLVENEIKDLFGVKINNIIVDYDGKLLLSEGAPYAPMCSKGQIEIEVKEG